jgi:protease-4
MNIYEKAAMQQSIEEIYGDFVRKVAEGRKMRESAVDSIGQGRVWSGVDAKRIGLVDEIGGLRDAIKGAASLAAIETYAVRELPEPEDTYTRIMNQLGLEIKARIISKELGESFRIYNELAELKDLTGIQMRLPYFVEIH